MPHTHINQNKDNKRNDCYIWICGMPTENIFLVKKKKKKCCSHSMFGKSNDTTSSAQPCTNQCRPSKVLLRPWNELHSPLGNGLGMCWKEIQAFLPFQAEHSRPCSVSMTKADRQQALMHKT